MLLDGGQQIVYMATLFYTVNYNIYKVDLYLSIYRVGLVYIFV